MPKQKPGQPTKAEIEAAYAALASFLLRKYSEKKVTKN